MLRLQCEHNYELTKNKIKLCSWTVSDTSHCLNHQCTEMNKGFDLEGCPQYEDDNGDDKGDNNGDDEGDDNCDNNCSVNDKNGAVQYGPYLAVITAVMCRFI